MARVSNPISVPAGVTVTVSGQTIAAKGPKGSAQYTVNNKVKINQEGSTMRFTANDGHEDAIALIGTTRAQVANVFRGVSAGFERKLELVGVGYRAQAQGKVLNLSLGFSHPVNYAIPEGITIETPTQTEILIKGIDKQKVGQVAAEIRQYRPPEPYKGKGVKYADEIIIRKEAKKK
ncbi:MAG: 50S ribosomal protein L6 [Thiohalomonadaceae bacterium]